MNNYSNATEILAGVWLGDLKSAHDTTFLNSKRIELVINCTDKHPFTDEPIIKVKTRLAVKDDLSAEESEKLYTYMFEATETIHQNRRQYNILVHCYAGVQRSATIIWAYLVRYGNMDFKSAIKAIKSKKPEVFQPNMNFEPICRRFYQDIHNHKHNHRHEQSRDKSQIDLDLELNQKIAESTEQFFSQTERDLLSPFSSNSPLIDPLSPESNPRSPPCSPPQLSASYPPINQEHPPTPHPPAYQQINWLQLVQSLPKLNAPVPLSDFDRFRLIPTG